MTHQLTVRINFGINKPASSDACYTVRCFTVYHLGYVKLAAMVSPWAQAQAYGKAAAVYDVCGPSGKVHATFQWRLHHVCKTAQEPDDPSQARSVSCKVLNNVKICNVKANGLLLAVGARQA